MANSYNELFGLGSHSEDASLVAHLKLQETTGTTAADSSSNGNNGTITGMGSNPTVTTGPTSWLPSAFDFDGTDDFVDLGTLGLAGDDHTVLKFMKRNTDTPGNALQSGFGWYGEGAATGGASHYPYTDGNIYNATLRGVGFGSNSRVGVGNPTPGMDSWRQICVKTTPGSNGWKFRMDGATLASDTGIAGLYMGGDHWIGKSTDNSTSYWFEGQIAGFAVFSRHLSDAEEADVFAGPEPLNLTAPSGSMSGGVFTGNVGTWDSQDNGTVSCAWELRDADDDSVVASGTAASGATIGDTGAYDGSYYLFVRASNDGGYDSAEDQTTANFTADGSTVVTADASDTLSLTDVAAVNTITTLPLSDSLSLSDIADNAVVRTTASDSIGFSETIGVVGDHFIDVTETLTLSDLYEITVPADAADTLSLSDDASSEIGHNYSESVSDTLSLSNTTSSDLDEAALTAAVTESLALTEAASCSIEFSMDLEEILTTTDTEIDPDTLEITTTDTGLRDEVGTPQDITESVSDVLHLSANGAVWILSPGGISESVSDTLSLSESGKPSAVGTSADTLSATDAASGFIAFESGDTLAMTDTASAAIEAGHSVSETLSISDTIGSFLVEADGCQTQTYDVSQAGAYAPVSAVTGFRLRFPSTSYTSEVVLRAPNLGNKDRISLQRINRVTRGGKLIMYRDAIWPLVETLVLSFSALKREEAVALQDFMQLSLGDEIALFDWEDREWRGVITEVNDPIVEDYRGSYSASFTFEGTKV